MTVVPSRASRPCADGRVAERAQQGEISDGGVGQRQVGGGRAFIARGGLRDDIAAHRRGNAHHRAHADNGAHAQLRQFFDGDGRRRGADARGNGRDAPPAETARRAVVFAVGGDLCCIVQLCADALDAGRVAGEQDRLAQFACAGMKVEGFAHEVLQNS